LPSESNVVTEDWRRMGLRVLLTCNELWSRSGLPLYVYDIALELHRRGHWPALFTLKSGAVGDELSRVGIKVSDNLRRLDFQPDIIHGNGFAPALSAVLNLSGVPGIFVRHDHTSLISRTPFHPRIRRYFGVSQVCIDRLMADGVSRNNIRLLSNFVDTNRFLPRPTLPLRPGRALIFSNYADAKTHLPPITESCRHAGLHLDVVGSGVGNPVDRPELILGNYDIVFAKGKAALEAMAVGTAVVLCDFSGLGPMVTSKEFGELRPLNFGFQALRNPLRSENISREIARYDPQDAAIVRDLVRSGAGLDRAVDILVDVYREVIDEYKRTPAGEREERKGIHYRRERLYLAILRTWLTLNPRQKATLKGIPGLMPLWKKTIDRLMH
jgi:hypothetical protein